MRRINYELLTADDESQPGQFKLPVVFKYKPNKERSIQEVFLVGTFTSWKDKIAMAKSDGDFVAIVDLAEGEHQYKFVVDGNWEHDPNQVSCGSAACPVGLCRVVVLTTVLLCFRLRLMTTTTDGTTWSRSRGQTSSHQTLLHQFQSESPRMFHRPRRKWWKRSPT